MSTVESMLQLLSKWPEWKRVTEAAGRVDALEARIAVLALEGSGGASGEAAIDGVTSPHPRPAIIRWGSLTRPRVGDFEVAAGAIRSVALQLTVVA